MPDQDKGRDKRQSHHKNVSSRLPVLRTQRDLLIHVERHRKVSEAKQDQASERIEELTRATTLATKRIAWATIITAGIGFLTAVFIAAQLREMRILRSDTEKYFHTDERAWIELGEIKVVALGNGKDYDWFSYDISPKNVGKTSAHDVEVYAGTRSGPYSLGFDKAAITKIQDQDLVNAQQPLDAAVAQLVCIDTQSVPKVIAPASQAPVPLHLIGSPPRHSRPGWEYTYLIGKIGYSDAFKTSHWLKFCFMVEDGGQGALRQCQEGNDEDRD